MKYFNNLFKRHPTKDEQKRLKSLFRTSFEQKTNLSVRTLGVTDVEFTISNKKGIVMIITLEYPSVLIGKSRQTIDAISEYISRRCPKPFSITLKEKTIWQ